MTMWRRGRNVAWIAMGMMVVVGCKEKDGPKLFATADWAPSYTEEMVRGMEVMGAKMVDEGVNFTTYSERATRIDVLLFTGADDERPIAQFPLQQFGNVWSLYVEGIGRGQLYGFVAWGPNWVEHDDWVAGTVHGFVADVDGEGNRFNPNKLMIDPWARALTRDHDWSMGSAASGPARTQSTWGAAVKGVVMDSQYSWSANEAVYRAGREDAQWSGHGWGDPIVYEVHLKGFTANPASGVDHPGTYRGLGEKADYLADLGITAVELLPIHEKPLDGGYWGYWTSNFFAPELTYASDPDPYKVMDEFKWMVDELHQRGIEVWLDVVYNHTGEGGLWRERIYGDDVSLDPATDAAYVNFAPKEVATLYSFRGLDNNAWYALSPDSQEYWNNTGVGNQTRPNHAPTRRLTMDSLRFYVEEMHVDGFRFDLAGILGERDGDYNNWDDPANTVLQDIIDDPVIQQYNTRIVAESWTAGGNYGALIGAYPNSSNREDMGWGEWNGNFRDWWRDFVNHDGWQLNSMTGNIDGGGSLTGSFDNYAWNGRQPYAAVNFITAHDGFTMYDLVTFAEKQNSCGPLNPVCCETPNSPWCDLNSGENENRSRDWGDEDTKRQMMRNFFAAMLLSHGTPMLLGGDEWMRTQLGNNNAYSSGADNEWNWFRWGEWQANDSRRRMHDFVRSLIQFRKDHGYALAPTTWGGGAPFSWRNATNTGDPDWNRRHLAMHYYDGSFGPELFIVVNMERGPVTFTLPAGRTWLRVLDTQAWFDSDAYIGGNGLDAQSNHNIDRNPAEVMPATYDVAGSSIAVFKAQ